MEGKKPRARRSRWGLMLALVAAQVAILLGAFFGPTVCRQYRIVRAVREAEAAAEKAVRMEHAVIRYDPGNKLPPPPPRVRSIYVSLRGGRDLFRNRGIVVTPVWSAGTPRELQSPREGPFRRLLDLCPGAIPAVGRRMRRAPEKARIAFLCLLAETGGRAAAPHIIERLGDQALSVRWAAAWALARKPSADAVGALLEALEGSDHPGFMLTALGAIKAVAEANPGSCEAARPALEKLAKHESREICLKALLALEAVRRPGRAPAPGPPRLIAPR